MISLIITVIASGWNSFKNQTTIVPNVNKQKCYFKGQSILNRKVYDRRGNLITSQPNDLTCDKCSDYIYRESTDKCIGYTHRNDNICTVKLGFAKPCPSEFIVE